MIFKILIVIYVTKKTNVLEVFMLGRPPCGFEFDRLKSQKPLVIFFKQSCGSDKVDSNQYYENQKKILIKIQKLRH